MIAISFRATSRRPPAFQKILRRAQRIAHSFRIGRSDWEDVNYTRGKSRNAEANCFAKTEAIASESAVTRLPTSKENLMSLKGAPSPTHRCATIRMKRNPMANQLDEDIVGVEILLYLAVDCPRRG